MPRRRQQEGYIFKARGMWYLRYTDTRVIGGEVKRVRIAKQLAPANLDESEPTAARSRDCGIAHRLC